MAVPLGVGGVKAVPLKKKRFKEEENNSDEVPTAIKIEKVQWGVKAFVASLSRCVDKHFRPLLTSINHLWT